MVLLKATYSRLHTALINPRSPTSTAMAICSSFCPHITNHSRRKPISPFSKSPPLFVSLKVLSTQTTASTDKGTLPISHGQFTHFLSRSLVYQLRNQLHHYSSIFHFELYFCHSPFCPRNASA